MNPAVKVSIIVPVYNVEKYLDRCMNSIINQSLKEIEVILVDDESPDNCPKMCDEYAQKDSRIKVIHKKNGGLGFARNSGLEVATGEYVAFCDSDDWIDLSMYETLYRIAKTENLDALYTEFNTEYYPGFHVILHDEKTYVGSEEIEGLILDMVGPEPEYDSDVKFQVSACKAIYRLDLIKKHHLLFHSERELISEDLIFNIDFLQQAFKVKTVPLQMYYYWSNPSSLSHAYRKNMWSKFSFFYEYLFSRKNEFDNPDDFIIRLHRSILLGVRGTIAQEYKYKRSKTEIQNDIKSILDSHYVNSLFQTYPFQLMSARHQLFYKAINTRNYWIIKLMYWLKDNLKRHS